ncbi:hypothetical protein PG994_012659 [Apiospora phragmitis]|uniref:Uncharacterized protein n=1 Tax=Apiospora phragmitis TaxID=2905665 RepID=A0ABR1TCV0_9PEZI
MMPNICDSEYIVQTATAAVVVVETKQGEREYVRFDDIDHLGILLSHPPFLQQGGCMLLHCRKCVDEVSIGGQWRMSMAWANQKE